jgi:FtsZ-binding cell division protein ZapB
MASESTIDENLQKVTSALAAGNKKYKIVGIGNDVYRAKCGSVFMKILFGCCTEYYQYDINLGHTSKAMVIVQCTSVCNGWLGGCVGARKTKGETERVKQLLSQAFPSRQVYSTTDTTFGGVPAPVVAIVETVIMPDGTKKISETAVNADGSQTATDTIIRFHDNNQLLREEGVKLRTAVISCKSEIDALKRSSASSEEMKNNLNGKLAELEAAKLSLDKEVDSWKERVASLGLVSEFHPIDPEEYKKALKECESLEKDKLNGETSLTESGSL